MIYFMLHGFNSATPNENSTFFEDNVLEDGDTLFNLNYPFNESAADVLIEQVEECLEGWCITTYRAKPTIDEITFVGCSLGGYMAQHMAGIYMGKAIIINPAVIPHETLMRFLGENTNFRTAETINLTEDDVKSFENFHIAPGRVPTLLLLDMGDELLDANRTLEHFEGHADIVTFEGGCHRFDHLPESIPAIKKFANTIV